jgi:hypothetical protein
LFYVTKKVTLTGAGVARTTCAALAGGDVIRMLAAGADAGPHETSVLPARTPAVSTESLMNSRRDNG